MSIINKGILDSRTAYLRQVGNDWPTSQVISTSDITEGINLYYTNARVVSVLTPYLTTSNIAEGSNLYYTNARVLSYVTPILTTSNVAEGSNLYYTNARVNSFIQGNLATKANVLDLTTANVSELTNLYYTNTRVYSNVIALLPTLAGSGIQIQANGQINSNTTLTLATLSQFLTTSNVAEGSNLYFTNARAQAAVASTGLNTFQAYISTFRGNAQLTTLRLPITPANNNYVTVIINGVTQLSNAYTLSGNVITLSGAPAANADIDVRILDVTQGIARNFNSRLFYGNGSANTFSISGNYTDSSILVFENGVAQVPTVDYSVNNGLLTFATAPRANVVVEIRELPTLNANGVYIGGQYISVLPNNQINSNVTAGQYITIQANGQINANIVSGQNIVIQANGQINATVQEPIHPFLLSLL